MRIKCIRGHGPLAGKIEAIAELEPDNVYGKPLGEVPIPAGEKRAEMDWFREPVIGELVISAAGRVFKWQQSDISCGGYDNRRIILKPKSEPSPKIWLLVENGGWEQFCDSSGVGHKVTSHELVIDDALTKRMFDVYWSVEGRTSSSSGIRAVLEALIAEVRR
jgi:hypothetical protein